MILATPAEQKGKPKPVALGLIGELHPAVRDAFGLRERVYLLALDFDRRHRAGRPAGRPTSRWPSSRR